MKIRTLLSACLLAAGLLFTVGANGAEKQPDTPTAVAKQFLNSLLKLDMDACVALSHGKMKDDAAEIGKTVKPLREAAAKGDENSVLMLNTMLEEAAKIKYEIKGEKIDGNAAVVEVVSTSEGKTKTEKMLLEKIDGKWKVTDLK